MALLPLTVDTIVLVAVGGDGLQRTEAVVCGVIGTVIAVGDFYLGDLVFLHTLPDDMGHARAVGERRLAFRPDIGHVGVDLHRGTPGTGLRALFKIDVVVVFPNQTHFAAVFADGRVFSVKGA